MALSRSVAALVAVAASLEACAASQAAGADAARSEILASDSDASCAAVSALQTAAGRRAGAGGAGAAGAAGAAGQSAGDEAEAASSRAAASAVSAAIRRRFGAASSASTEVLNDIDSLVASIKASEGLPASDPYWEKAKTFFQEIVGRTPDGLEWMNYEKEKNYVSFNKKSCDPAGDGSQLDLTVTDKEVPIDAWYCGRADLDWSSSGGKPYADLCSATVGTAKDPDGVCGSVGTKQLLLNLVHRGPSQWSNHAFINVPSLDCLMDIGDGDIYYCQHCSGRCATA